MKILNERTQSVMNHKWSTADESQRSVMIATNIFGYDVDENYDKLVERKESGGVRLLPIPVECKRDGSESVREKMDVLGWKAEVIAKPRSSRVSVIYYNEKLDAQAETHTMPQDQALRYGALLAIQLEREIANA